MNKRIICLCAVLCALLVMTSVSFAKLLVYLPLDEGKGKAPQDASGNGHHAQFEADPAWVDGKFGKALEFEGQKWISMPTPDPEVFNEEFTLVVYIKPPLAGNQWQQIVRCNPVAGTGRNSWFVNTAGFMSWRGFVGVAWTVWSTTPQGLIEADEWTHIAITSDKKDFVQFINGKKEQEDDFVQGDGAIEIIGLGWGGSSGGESYDGAIDEFAIFDEVLDDALISDIMDLGVTDALAVESRNKLATSWGRVKSER